jgi:hypothetical protein
MKDHLGNDLPVSNVHSNLHAGEAGPALRPGFPRSMLLPAAASGRLLAMLRKNGLTTAAIKEVIAAPWARTAVGKVTGSREDAIVRLLSSPRRRANIFVWTADKKKSVPSCCRLKAEFCRPSLLTGRLNIWSARSWRARVLSGIESRRPFQRAPSRAHMPRPLTYSCCGQASNCHSDAGVASMRTLSSRHLMRRSRCQHSLVTTGSYSERLNSCPSL